MGYIEEVDKLKTKVLKYILYKKRTEQEVKQKFTDVDENVLEEIIEHFKILGYISDEEYIEKAVNEYMKLKNMSIKEVRYSLIAKGLKDSLVTEYIDKNEDMLLKYERNSARKLCLKKSNSLSKEEITSYLYKKGYLEETIKGAIDG